MGVEPGGFVRCNVPVELDDDCGLFCMSIKCRYANLAGELEAGGVGRDGIGELDWKDVGPERCLVEV